MPLWIVVIFWIAVSYLVLKTVLYRLLVWDVVRATLERDPAATSSWTVVYSYAGVQALFYYRIARIFLALRMPFFARMLSQWARGLTGIEIHPAATIGKGLFIDHGMGVVIGETTVIGDQVTLFQGVTLGGTGKEKGKRHPTLGNNVVVGAGAKILGNIKVGKNVSVGANAVVLKDVSPNCTVVGVPGRIARREGKKLSEVNVDYTSLPDPLTQSMEKIQDEIEKIELELKKFTPPPDEGSPRRG